MFTGIIETTGKVKRLTGRQLVVEARGVISDLKKGSSVAVDGVCLTVVQISDDSFTADFMPETAQKTIIGTYKPGHHVNLELPMRAGGRFEGHIVTGHAEGTGEITRIKSDGNARVLTIKLPPVLAKYVVPKGSVALNGISLTVASVHDDEFSVSIIPYTWEVTNLHTLKKDNKVNLETDILAKHVEKLVKKCG